MTAKELFRHKFEINRAKGHDTNANRVVGAWIEALSEEECQMILDGVRVHVFA
jgi:hypothetical protein